MQNMQSCKRDQPLRNLLREHVQELLNSLTALCRHEKYCKAPWGPDSFPASERMSEEEGLKGIAQIHKFQDMFSRSECQSSRSFGARATSCRCPEELLALKRDLCEVLDEIKVGSLPLDLVASVYMRQVLVEWEKLVKLGEHRTTSDSSCQ